jgi:hypothetical protein
VNVVGIAKRIRGGMIASDHLLMETVVCDQCGQRFAIPWDPATTNAELAKKQASFLEDKLVWDHIREQKHPGSIKLPKV